jgi:hypothetical protein
MTRDLIQHVLKKRHPRVKLNLTRTVETKLNADLGLKRIALNARAARLMGDGHDGLLIWDGRAWE